LLLGHRPALSTELLHRLQKPALVITTGSVRAWRPATLDAIRKKIGYDPAPDPVAAT
jgi:hypothetical protein